MSASEPWLLLPEFIALFVGMFACWGLSLSYVLWNRRPSRRQQLRAIHENLNKVHLAWSNNEATIKAASEIDFRKENYREQKWFLLAGTVLSVASWLGFILLIVLIMSLEFLAKPRMERAVFDSDLARDKSLSPEAVQILVNRLLQK
ncbi:hypothetical protein [Bdellovibrio sp. HCB337]|uniref:hypothetical protein n=1 Tax=Bdellovibrio sp. HCB337 TaxID=3394358 RepID=UPI0039A597ED